MSLGYHLECFLKDNKVTLELIEHRQSFSQLAFIPLDQL